MTAAITTISGVWNIFNTKCGENATVKHEEASDVFTATARNSMENSFIQMWYDYCYWK